MALRKPSLIHGRWHSLMRAGSQWLALANPQTAMDTEAAGLILLRQLMTSSTFAHITGWVLRKIFAVGY